MHGCCKVSWKGICVLHLCVYHKREDFSILLYSSFPSCKFSTVLVRLTIYCPPLNSVDCHILQYASPRLQVPWPVKQEIGWAFPFWNLMILITLPTASNAENGTQLSCYCEPLIRYRRRQAWSGFIVCVIYSPGTQESTRWHLNCGGSQLAPSMHQAET